MIRVEVIVCLGPRQWDWTELSVAEGASLVDALHGSGMLVRHGLTVDQLVTGVWGRRQTLSQVLREGDRVEVYRPLQCDPKEARRLRYRQTPGRARRVKRLSAATGTAAQE